MVPQEAPGSAQCRCPLPACPSAKDEPQRTHARRSRQHQRFMARKALLQEQGLLSRPAQPGPSGPPDQQPRPGGRPPGRRRAPLATPGPWPSKCVALDCEMVGTGPRGRVSELARCSVVSYDGDVLYDKYVRPERPVADYRTRWSGITREHMLKAIPFQVAQKEILRLLKGKVVVGHALHNDFQALKYVHPRSRTRDTTCVPSLLGPPGLATRSRVSLKDLALRLLHKKIQVGRHGHSSVEDAATAMELYRLVEARWEEQAGHLLQDEREPDGGPDVERYMEDRYWPEDMATAAGGLGGREEDGGQGPQGASGD